MTQINSSEIHVERRIEQVFQFLTDLRNYKHLIPDSDHFEADMNRANLNVKGLGAFVLRLVESRQPGYIKLQPEGKLPFQFHIEWNLKPNGEHTLVQGVISAQMNPFIRMMAEPKLKQLADYQGHKLKEQLERSMEP